MKGAGMRWTTTGAQQAATLRMLLLSDRWQEVADQCRTAAYTRPRLQVTPHGATVPKVLTYESHCVSIVLWLKVPLLVGPLLHHFVNFPMGIARRGTQCAEMCRRSRAEPARRC